MNSVDETNTNHAFEPPAASLLVTISLSEVTPVPSTVPSCQAWRSDWRERDTVLSETLGSHQRPCPGESARSDANSPAFSPGELWALGRALEFINNTVQTAVRIFILRSRDGQVLDQLRTPLWLTLAFFLKAIPCILAPRTCRFWAPTPLWLSPHRSMVYT